MKVVDKIIAVTKSINHFFDVRSGLQAYEKGKGHPPQTALDVKNHIFDRDNWEDENSFRYLQGKDIGRYQLNWSGMWLQYGPWLSQPREFEIFSRPRVLLREITADLPYCLKATYLSEFVYLNNKSILNILHPENDIEELICLLGILNSKIISIYYKQRAVKSLRKIFPKVVIRNMREFPYPIITKKQKKTLSILVEQMLDLHKKLNEAKIPHAKDMLIRQIETTDKQIDQLVYKLYDLSEKEIKIVESKS